MAETFLVALRRLDEVPDEPSTRAWLYGVARRVLANQRRGDVRRSHLGERLRDQLVTSLPDHADPVVAAPTPTRLLGGLARPTARCSSCRLGGPRAPRDRRGARLSPGAVRVRLNRARRPRVTVRRRRTPLHDTHPKESR